jgi:hypothetical protein
MIIHEPTLISEDLLEKFFICDLNTCKGACCVEGDFGAPLEDDERDTLQHELENIKPYLSSEGLSVIALKGIAEKDKEGDLVTTCTKSGECVFSIYEHGVLGCGIEKAWKDGATTFQKPISCHLYPIRVTKVAQYDALNYHRWEVCKPACRLGEQHKVPVYQFLQGALTRKYGAAWYIELCNIAEAYLQK